MDADVIVIGAGAAGLRAAYELARENIKVIVLEARERIGGRIYTNHHASPANPESVYPVELGAEFVHGVAPDLLDVARLANLKVVETIGASWFVDENQNLALAREQFDESEQSIWRELANYDESDLSFQDFLTNCCVEAKFEQARQSVLGYVEGFHAADAKKASTHGIAKAERASNQSQGDRAFRVSEGYAQITNWLYEQILAKGSVVKLNSIVKNVRWQKEFVEVEVREQITNENKTYAAKRIVVTLPLNILKADSSAAAAVCFEPKLDDVKLKALKKIEMGAALRVSFCFKNDWWTQKLLSLKPNEIDKLGFLFARDESFPVWWTPQPSAAPVLTAWVGGTRALQTNENLSIVDAAIDSLTKIFKVTKDFINRELETIYFHNWQEDEFSLGAYSYLLVDGIDAPNELARPIENTLFFAGEATNTEGHIGTVHGAIATGKRAASEIIQSLHL